MLESILRAAELRTGLYTSPHLERINERIRIDGKEISDEDFAAAFTHLHEVIEELLAVKSFSQLILRFSSASRLWRSTILRQPGSNLPFAKWAWADVWTPPTRPSLPEVAVITQIDFDHENYLGHSIEEIAWEKADIVGGARVVRRGRAPDCTGRDTPACGASGCVPGGN